VTSNDDVHKSRLLGAAAHLVKPVDREALLAALKQFCPVMIPDPANVPMARTPELETI
jgi:hypothetical protein